MVVTRQTIRIIEPLTKNGEATTNVELISFEDNRYSIVINKGLYKVGDKVIFIPAYTKLPEREEFREYFAPDGDPSKCMLGSCNGIRNVVKPVKFNMKVEENYYPIYSEGIIIPDINIPEEELDSYLGIKALNIQ